MNKKMAVFLIGKFKVTLTEIENTGAGRRRLCRWCDYFCLDTVIFEEHVPRNFDIFLPGTFCFILNLASLLTQIFKFCGWIFI